MAGYVCEFCEGEEPGAILITPLSGGDTMAIGTECMPIALTGMLAGTLGIDGDQLYEAAAAMQTAAQDAQDAPDGSEPPAPAVPKRKPGASGRRPARPSREATRQVARKAGDGTAGATAALGGEPQ